MLKAAKSTLAVVALLAWASPALADTTFSNASDFVKPKPFDLHDYFTMDTTVYYGGSSVTGLGSPYQPTSSGYDDPTSPNSFTTRFRPQYKITPDITIGPVVEWNYMPNFGGDYNFGDVFIRVMDAKVVDTKDLHVMGDLRFYTPTSNISQAQQMMFSARAYHDGYYTFRKTHLSLGLEQYLRGWVYGSGAPVSGTTIDGVNLGTSMLVQWWWAPYLNYDFSPKFAVKLQYSGDFYSKYGDNDVHNSPSYVRFGVGWSPTPWLFLAPHVYAPTTSPGFSWSAAALNLEAWAQLF